MSHLTRAKKLKQTAFNCSSLVSQNSKHLEVETIIDRKFHRSSRNFQYLIKWKGKRIEASTWEPIENLLGAEDMLIEFEKNYQEVVIPLQPSYAMSGLPFSPYDFYLHNQTKIEEKSERMSSRHLSRRDLTNRRKRSEEKDLIKVNPESPTRASDRKGKEKIEGISRAPGSSSHRNHKKYLNKREKEKEESRKPIKKSTLCVEDIESPDIRIESFLLEEEVTNEKTLNKLEDDGRRKTNCPHLDDVDSPLIKVHEFELEDRSFDTRGLATAKNENAQIECFCEESKMTLDGPYFEANITQNTFETQDTNAMTQVSQSSLEYEQEKENKKSELINYFELGRELTKTNQIQQTNQADADDKKAKDCLSFNQFINSLAIKRNFDVAGLFGFYSPTISVGAYNTDNEAEEESPLKPVSKSCKVGIESQIQETPNTKDGNIDLLNSLYRHISQNDKVFRPCHENQENENKEDLLQNRTVPDLKPFALNDLRWSDLLRWAGSNKMVSEAIKEVSKLKEVLEDEVRKAKKEKLMECKSRRKISEERKSKKAEKKGKVGRPRKKELTREEERDQRKQQEKIKKPFKKYIAFVVKNPIKQEEGCADNETNVQNNKSNLENHTVEEQEAPQKKILCVISQGNMTRFKVKKEEESKEKINPINTNPEREIQGLKMEALVKKEQVLNSIIKTKEEMQLEYIPKEKEIVFEKTTSARHPIVVPENNSEYFSNISTDYLAGRMNRQEFLDQLCPKGNFKDDEVQEIECMSWHNDATDVTSNYFFRVVWKPRSDGTQKQPIIVPWEEIKKEAPKHVLKYCFKTFLNFVHKYGTFREI